MAPSLLRGASDNDRSYIAAGPTIRVLCEIVRRHCRCETSSLLRFLKLLRVSAVKHDDLPTQALDKRKEHSKLLNKTN